MKVHDFRGDLPDISAETKSLMKTGLRECWRAWQPRWQEEHATHSKQCSRTQTVDYPPWGEVRRWNSHSCHESTHPEKHKHKPTAWFQTPTQLNDIGFACNFQPCVNACDPNDAYYQSQSLKSLQSRQSLMKQAVNKYRNIIRNLLDILILILYYWVNNRYIDKIFNHFEQPVCAIRRHCWRCMCLAREFFSQIKWILSGIISFCTLTLIFTKTSRWGPSIWGRVSHRL